MASNLFTLLAQAAAPNAAEAAEAAQGAAADQLNGTVTLIIAAAIIIGSFVAGGLIARGLRMKDYGFKIGLVLFALAAGVTINYFGWPPKLGIDLSGGVVLVYEVDTDLTTSDWMKSAVARINEQLNKEGGEKLQAQPISDDEIQIDVPAGVDVDKVQNTVDGLRDTADVVLHLKSKQAEDGKTTLVYRADPGEDQDVDMDELIAAVQRRINPGGVKELTIRQYGPDQIEVIVPEVEEREIEQIKQKISKSGLLEFRIVANRTDDRDLIRVAERTPGNNVYIGGKLEGRWVDITPELMNIPLAAYRESPNGTPQILARIDPFNVDGRYLVRAAGGYGERGRVVEFSFNSEGAEKFGQLTGRNLPDATGFRRNLGIVLDNVMLSAPTLRSRIRDSGQIEGDFTEEEIEVLVGILNAGRLPATLRPEPISQQAISATLGADTIRAGANAMIISTLAILVFMLVYYRFAGIVADLAVTLNVIITVALMILIKAAFTLPGLAGLVLTVGMAVDANVLIYERIREESERGSSLRMAIRNGFSRATGTIIDANITTLITAAVLYLIGTDQIKGFAVTLILGLLVSMFTAIFVSRVIFDIAERQKWIAKLTMMRIIGHTDYNFIRWRAPALAASLIVVVVGLVAVVARGKELLDIDFTGGSSVQIQFAEGKQESIAEVRAAVAALPDVAVSSVGEEGLSFKIDTSDRDIDAVQKMLRETFAGKLETYAMSFGELAAIEPQAEEAADESAGEAAAPAEASETPPPDETKQAPPADDAAEKQSPAEAEKTEPEAEPEAEKPAEPEASPEPEGTSEPSEPESGDSEPAEEPAAEGSKPAEEQPSEQSAPEEDSARRRPPTGIEVASASDSVALLALLQDESADDAEPAPQDESIEAAPGDASDTPPEDAADDTPPAGDETEPADETQPAGEPATDEAPTADDASAEETIADTGGLTSGTQVELTFPDEIAHDPLREMIQSELDAMDLRETAFQLTNPDYSPGSEARYEKWRLATTLDESQTRELLDNIQQKLAATPVFPSSSEIGGKVAGDTQLKAMYAMLASMVIIVIYVWIRFQNAVFGLAAVVALVHDVMITIAFLAISAFISPYLGALLVDPFKISLAVVAALLTIVGFSINDTIVVFDRIREVRGKSPDLTPEMINRSVNQTLSRTLLTSGTVFIASIILYVVGGPGIHAFAYAMVVGVIAGTYSSVYIAAPVLLWLRRPMGTPPAVGSPHQQTAAAARN